ncbi:hypothetical protein F3I45_05480 [Pantoea sp. F_7]|nr:hypothetical protein F3I45_05480 [Pantoea sp. F_7]KAA6026123.1 hypothetical protein F3I42_05480 [Pantoea sp. F_17]KAA6034604.1 hypothetical protein F3I41_05480 [Pantoea sp. F_16]
MRTKNAGSVFEQRKALARQRAHLRDEVRTKNAGSVFEQRKALARQRAHLRDEVRTKNAGSVFEQRKALARQRAHLRDEVRNRAGRACHELALASFRTDRISCSSTISQRSRSGFAVALNGPRFGAGLFFTASSTQLSQPVTRRFLAIHPQLTTFPRRQ